MSENKPGFDWKERLRASVWPVVGMVVGVTLVVLGNKYDVDGAVGVGGVVGFVSTAFLAGVWFLPKDGNGDGGGASGEGRRPLDWLLRGTEYRGPTGTRRKGPIEDEDE